MRTLLTKNVQVFIFKKNANRLYDYKIYASIIDDYCIGNASKWSQYNSKRQTYDITFHVQRADKYPYILLAQIQINRDARKKQC